MKKYHPDRAVGGAPLSESKAAEINDAFRILRNPGRRAKHDAEEKAWRPVKQEWSAAPLQTAPPRPPEQGPQRRPPPPPPYIRPGALSVQRPVGRRLVGWAGIVAALLLIGFTVANTRGSGGIGAASFSETLLAAAGQRPQAEAETALAATSAPVSKLRVAEALVEFERVRALYGPIGVAAYSDACFEAQSRSRNVGEFDFCVAFDHAASALDASVSNPLPLPLVPRYSDEQLLSRHAGAAKLQPGDYAGLDNRLADIKVMTREAIAGRNEQSVPLNQPPLALARVEPPHQPARARPRPDRKPQPARRPKARQGDADFLEREGGIY